MGCIVPDPAPQPTVAQFFRGRPEARALFGILRRFVESDGRATLRVTRSQIAFVRRRAFAWVWTPDRWLRGETAPLVLSVALPAHDPSPRWKSVVQPAPGRWTHHLEIWSASDLDAEVGAWLHEAASQAGAPPKRATTS